MQLSGILKRKFDTVQVSENFTKREFVIETVEQYSQQVIFQLVKDKCSIIDSFEEGTLVNVEANIRGRAWTSPQGEEKWFNTLEAWRISTITDQKPNAVQPNTDFEKPPLETANEASSEERTDGLPFG